MNAQALQIVQQAIKPLILRIQLLQRDQVLMKNDIRSLWGRQSNTEKTGECSASASATKDEYVAELANSRGLSKANDDCVSIFSKTSSRPPWRSITKMAESPRSTSKDPVRKDKIKRKPPIPKPSMTPTKNTGKVEENKQSQKNIKAIDQPFLGNNEKEKHAKPLIESEQIKQYSNISFFGQSNKQLTSTNKSSAEESKLKIVSSTIYIQKSKVKPNIANDVHRSSFSFASEETGNQTNKSDKQKTNGQIPFDLKDKQSQETIVSEKTSSAFGHR